MPADDVAEALGTHPADFLVIAPGGQSGALKTRLKPVGQETPAEAGTKAKRNRK
jgi:hypothetical protein